MILCLLIMTSAGCGRDSDRIGKNSVHESGDAKLLRWRVPKGKVFALKTAISSVDSSKDNAIKFNLEEMFKGMSEGDTPSEEIKKALNGELRMPKDYSMVTVLKGEAKDTISIRMIMEDFDPPAQAEGLSGDTYQKLIDQMKGSVQLRGDITPSGSIRTFYLESKQKNLLSLFFELPQAPVRIGDSWELHVNLLSMGHGFICDAARRINRVTLVSLEPTDTEDQIATMEYTLFESAKGRFVLPGFDEDKPAGMSFSFIGRGRFSLRQGVWESFVGLMEIKGTGMMKVDTQQVFAMQPMAKIPEQYLKLK